MLQHCYPQFKGEKFGREKQHKTQSAIFRYIKHMLPLHEVLKEQTITLVSSAPIKLDIYIPSIKLAVEYKGILTNLN